jgi:hypothetical protein
LFLFLVSWVVLSVVGGVVVGTAIHRADVMERRWAADGRPADDYPQPYAPRSTASAPASASGPMTHVRTWAA